MRCLNCPAAADGRSRFRIASVAAAEAEIATARKAGTWLVAAQEPDYPWRLATTEDASPLISLADVAALSSAPFVSIVGARNTSSNGKRIARKIAQGLGEAGVTVASGPARGIDAAALTHNHAAVNLPLSRDPLAGRADPWPTYPQQRARDIRLS